MRSTGIRCSKNTFNIQARLFEDDPFLVVNANRNIDNDMPLVSYNCSAAAPANLAFKILAKVQDTDVDFSDASQIAPSLKAVTTNPVLGSSTTSTSVSWLGCARTLSQLIPSLGLWDGPTVESWVESAVTSVVPALEGSGT
jgi:hypothetical protein